MLLEMLNAPYLEQAWRCPPFREALVGELKRGVLERFDRAPHFIQNLLVFLAASVPGMT